MHGCTFSGISGAQVGDLQFEAGQRVLVPSHAPLGFGRIIASEIEAPNMLVNLI